MLVVEESSVCYGNASRNDPLKTIVRFKKASLDPEELLATVLLSGVTIGHSETENPKKVVIDTVWGTCCNSGYIVYRNKKIYILYAPNLDCWQWDIDEEIPFDLYEVLPCAMPMTEYSRFCGSLPKNLAFVENIVIGSYPDVESPINARVFTVNGGKIRSAFGVTGGELDFDPVPTTNFGVVTSLLSTTRTITHYVSTSEDEGIVISDSILSDLAKMRRGERLSFDFCKKYRRGSSKSYVKDFAPFVLKRAISDEGVLTDFAIQQETAYGSLWTECLNYAFTRDESKAPLCALYTPVDDAVLSEFSAQLDSYKKIAETKVLDNAKAKVRILIDKLRERLSQLQVIHEAVESNYAFSMRFPTIVGSTIEEFTEDFFSKYGVLADASVLDVDEVVEDLSAKVRSNVEKIDSSLVALMNGEWEGESVETKESVMRFLYEPTNGVQKVYSGGDTWYYHPCGKGARRESGGPFFTGNIIDVFKNGYISQNDTLVVGNGLARTHVEFVNGYVDGNGMHESYIINVRPTDLKAINLPEQFVIEVLKSSIKRTFGKYDPTLDVNVDFTSSELGPLPSNCAYENRWELGQHPFMLNSKPNGWDTFIRFFKRTMFNAFSRDGELWFQEYMPEFSFRVRVSKSFSYSVTAKESYQLSLTEEKAELVANWTRDWLSKNLSVVLDQAHVLEVAFDRVYSDFSTANLLGVVSSMDLPEKDSLQIIANEIRSLDDYDLNTNELVGVNKVSPNVTSPSSSKLWWGNTAADVISKDLSLLCLYGEVC